MSTITLLLPGEVASLLGIGAANLASAVLGEITEWVSVGASAVLQGAGHALDATTAMPINGGFTAPFELVRRAGAALVGVFFALALLQAVIRRDLADLGRTLLIRLPIALIGAGVALQLVELALQATDSLSASILSTANGSDFTSDLGSLLGAVGTGPTGGFEVLVLALFAAFVAFALWVELVIRSSAIAVAALFIPLALTGVIWTATANWARRLGEMLGALICSKLVIAGVFALAVSELGQPTGVAGLIQGIALLLLASLSPWVLFRLVPTIEAGVVTHLDGVGSRAVRSVGRSTSVVGDLLDAGQPDLVPTRMPSIPSAEGSSLDSPEFRSLVAQFETDIAARSGQTEVSPSAPSEATGDEDAE